MGFVKLLKADKTFDLLPAEGIAKARITGTTIVFSYVAGYKLTVAGIDQQEDIDKILTAAIKIDGASLDSIAPDTLSASITGVTGTILT
jgi:hypothetical protein|tara:strand:- start:564 stop:830 length:267 start_codon:yes stop_codon:yes gene_type:complete